MKDAEELTACVVCGAPLQRSAASRCYDHHCDAKREATIESRRKSYNADRQIGRTFRTRLSEGFAMMTASESEE